MDVDGLIYCKIPGMSLYWDYRKYFQKGPIRRARLKLYDFEIYFTYRILNRCYTDMSIEENHHFF